MKAIILNKLKAIESLYKVKVLYACESGSRAWGFASPDSDFDVRFIYVHTMDYYLSIDEQRDVIECPINDVLDVNGWELRKALRLFRKSNAPLLEWLSSPVVYVEDRAFVQELRSLTADYFSARAAMHHYLSMAKGVFEHELVGKNVKLKKYFYALRPVLAAKWIADLNSIPPMDFASLRVMMPDQYQDAVDQLLSIKSTVDESYMIEVHADLNAFLDQTIRYCEAKVPMVAGKNENSKLNAVFKKYIG